eukprot:2627611-Prymnesium_polylepis.1
MPYTTKCWPSISKSACQSDDVSELSSVALLNMHRSTRLKERKMLRMRQVDTVFATASSRREDETACTVLGKPPCGQHS